MRPTKLLALSVDGCESRAGSEFRRRLLHLRHFSSAHVAALPFGVRTTSPPPAASTMMTTAPQQLQPWPWRVWVSHGPGAVVPRAGASNPTPVPEPYCFALATGL